MEIVLHMQSTTMILYTVMDLVRLQSTTMILYTVMDLVRLLQSRKVHSLFSDPTKIIKESNLKNCLRRLVITGN
jgi:hypothetical protein